MKKKLRIATRTSKLAKIQATIVQNALISSTNCSQSFDIEIVPIDTSGDWREGQEEKTFLDMGANKGLFTKEIEDALASGFADIAVHSMKDVPAFPPEHLAFVVLLKRDDPRDAFVSLKAGSLQELAPGCRVGSSSLRRQAQLRILRPDLDVVPFRGNVDTRLQKIEKGVVDATLLAVAGLSRLGRMDAAVNILNEETMLPCPGQGALGVQIRRDDDVLRELLAPLNDEATMACVAAERAVLKVLDGSCRAPVAALAVMDETGLVTLDALAAKPDGSALFRAQRTGAALDAEKLGNDLGLEIKGRLPADFFTV